MNGLYKSQCAATGMVMPIIETRQEWHAVVPYLVAVVYHLKMTLKISALRVGALDVSGPDV
uniref:Uncharacterized protein n=1 Tax=Magallana gigas TaxID=29159 RepID=K1PEX1_MAGGI